jgi:hypothetical protein
VFVDEVNDDDSINSIIKLREIVKTVKKFTDVDECIEFIMTIEDEKIFMICSEEHGQTTVLIVYNIIQIH